MFKSLIPTLSIVVSIVLYMSFISPQYSEVKLVQAEIEEYKKTIGQYSTFNTELNTLLTKKSNISPSNLMKIDRMIPDKADTTRILVDLEAMANKRGLLFGNISATTQEQEVQAPVDGMPETDEDSLVASDISFEVIGTYEQFKSFIADLEQSLTLMEVTEMSLEAATDSFQQYSITVQTYSLQNS